MRSSLSEVCVFVTDFTYILTFRFLYAQLSVVVPPFLRLHLDLRCVKAKGKIEERLKKRLEKGGEHLDRKPYEGEKLTLILGEVTI